MFLRTVSTENKTIVNKKRLSLMASVSVRVYCVCARTYYAFGGVTGSLLTGSFLTEGFDFDFFTSLASN